MTPCPDSPRVSVLMPAWNRARFIEEAMSSVLGQTFRDLELIVVDDGSTDDTAELVRSCRDSRVKLFQQDHAGISAALNRALEVASGQYVARLDSDDVWLPSFLDVQLEVLEKHPGVDIVYAKGECMDAKGRALPSTWGTDLRYPSDPLRSFLYADPTCNITVLARRSCFDRVGGYDESLHTSEDWDIWVRMAVHFRFRFVDRVLARIRRHDACTTGGHELPDDDVYRNRLRVLDKAFADPAVAGPYADVKGVAYGNVHTINGLLYWTCGDRRRAAASFRRAVAVSDRRLFTVVRIAWFSLAWRCLNRSRAGRSIVRGLHAWRAKRRRMQAAA